MKKILLDTNAYSALLAGNQDVLARLAESEQVLLSVVVLGELFCGFKGGPRERENRELLADFLRRPPVRVVEISMSTAEIFAQVKDRLRKAGRPIPLNDIWIAAQALEGR
jgi:tRNA(fMet)-specific endonuclease VapC